MSTTNDGYFKSLTDKEQELLKHLKDAKQTLIEKKQEIANLETEIHKIEGGIEVTRNMKNTFEGLLKKEAKKQERVSGTYANKTIIEAAYDILSQSERPMRSQDICQELLSGGIETKSDPIQFGKIVSGALNRASSDPNSNIIKEKRGVWKLKESSFKEKEKSDYE